MHDLTVTVSLNGTAVPASQYGDLFKGLYAAHVATGQYNGARVKSSIEDIPSRPVELHVQLAIG